MSEQTAEIFPFTGITRLDTRVELILEKAAAAGLDSIVVLGADEDGTPFFASSQADGAQVLWHLELAKKRLFEVFDRLSKGD